MLCFADLQDHCDRALCEKLSPDEYNVTKATRCYIDCCSEDLCNEGELAVAEELSSAENLVMGCLSLITLALVTSFTLGNHYL